MSQRTRKNASGVVLSWLRYEYEGLKLLRIDEVYDYDDDTVLEDPADGDDRWRPLNVYVHGPGEINDILRAHWYAYDDTGDSWCYEGNYYYTYDALGNVLGVFQYGEFSRWEMDAFGNDLPGGNDFLPMDQEGPKEHLTGKMYDEDTGLYYFHARWYDPEVGRFVSTDPIGLALACLFSDNAPTMYVDPSGLFAADPEPAPALPGCKCRTSIGEPYDRLESEEETKPEIRWYLYDAERVPQGWHIKCFWTRHESWILIQTWLFGCRKHKETCCCAGGELLILVMEVCRDKEVWKHRMSKEKYYENFAFERDLSVGAREACLKKGHP